MQAKWTKLDPINIGVTPLLHLLIKANNASRYDMFVNFSYPKILITVNYAVFPYSGTMQNLLTATRIAR